MDGKSVTSKVGSLEYVVDHLDFLSIGGEGEGAQLPQEFILACMSDYGIPFHH